jgi:predicted GNAT superfamily acetyltransferase
VREAYAQAEAAAEAAGVRVRDADPRDMDAVVGLFERTWGQGRSPDRAMLQAMDYAGTTVLIATESAPGGASVAVGATLGFLGWEDGLHLHSHMNAVAPWRRSGGVGHALKLLQRAICLDRGVTEVRWTFDPLIRRNAHVNLVKLGGEVTAFLPDFYGRLDDAITGTDRSDRFEVRWRLDSERVRRALARQSQPVWTGSETFALADDFETLRVEDPPVAARIRSASRAAFPAALAAGLRPELTTGNDYIFTADDPDRAPESPAAAAGGGAGDAAGGAAGDGSPA